MNIEEFVNDYLQEHRHDVLLNPYNSLVDFAYAFQEKLMKEAAVGRINPFGFHNAVSTKDPAFTEMLDKLKSGDKVRIIIVKEDEK